MTTSCVTHEMADLNTSDHLPLTASLVYSTVPKHEATENENAMPSRIDWAEAERNGAVLAFSAEIGHKLEPLFSKLYDDPSQIGAEIEQVAGILQKCAGRALPCVQPKKGRR